MVMHVETRGDDAALLIRREITAPVARVYEAWSRAEELERWMAPDEMTATASIDFRPGGAIDLTIRGPDGATRARGVYTEIIPRERIAMRIWFEDVPGHEIYQTVTFAESGGRTIVTLRQVMPPWKELTAKERELLRPRARGAPVGWSQSLQHLDQLVTSRP
jgi:uncharacterized protein YndB with AHSA1/START domain